MCCPPAARPLDEDRIHSRPEDHHADSASAWDLKCDMREHLVRFVREKYPESLPRFRVETSA
ncbi:hypothetical protein [Planomonospora algeriensis]